MGRHVLRPAVAAWMRGGGLRPYRTASFDAWQAQAGAAAAGQASALGDWGPNLVTNGEFSADTAMWIANAATLSRVDSAVEPGTASGGADNWALKVIANGDSAWGKVEYARTIGAVYTVRAYAYAPSSNTQVNAARVGSINAPSSIAEVTAEDAWQLLSVSPVAADASDTIILTATATGGFGTAGDVAYFDKAEAYRQNAPLLSPHRASSGTWLWTLNVPATGVVPWSAIVRYVDSLNYWEVRVLSNTAGNDTQIIEVSAGVETVRAAADVDWTAGATEYLRVTARGTTIDVDAYKAGGAWADACSYASATTHQGASRWGEMLWETGVTRATGVEYRP